MWGASPPSRKMLRAHQSLRLFDAPFPSLVPVLAPTHADSDHREYALGKGLMVVFDHRKAEYTPGCFSSKTSDAERNPTAVCVPAYSSSRKSGEVMNLVAECALECFFSTKRMGKLR